MKRGQFGQLPRKSDIGPSSGGFWENYPNYPTVQHRMFALDCVFAAKITPMIHNMSAPVDRNNSKIFEGANDG